MVPMSQALALKSYLFGSSKANVPRKYATPALRHRLSRWIYAAYDIFSYYHLQVIAEIEIHKTRDYILQLYNYGSLYHKPPDRIRLVLCCSSLSNLSLSMLIKCLCCLIIVKVVINLTVNCFD